MAVTRRGWFTRCPRSCSRASSPVLAVREAIPKAHALAKAEFATIRLRLLKIAARVTESASRVRLAFAAACPDAALFRQIAAELRPTPS